MGVQLIGRPGGEAVLLSIGAQLERRLRWQLQASAAVVNAPPRVQRVCMVSMHTSPAQAPGTGDSGGMNVALLATAHELALRGIAVDLVTRAAGPASGHRDRAGRRRCTNSPPARPDRFRKRNCPASPRVRRRSWRGWRPGRGAATTLIHAHYWLSGMAAQAVASDLGVPFVQSFHTLGAMKNQSLAPGQRAEPARRLSGEQFLAAAGAAPSSPAPRRRRPASSTTMRRRRRTDLGGPARRRRRAVPARSGG